MDASFESPKNILSKESAKSVDEWSFEDDQISCDGLKLKKTTKKAKVTANRLTMTPNIHRTNKRKRISPEIVGKVSPEQFVLSSL